MYKVFRCKQYHITHSVIFYLFVFVIKNEQCRNYEIKKTYLLMCLYKSEQKLFSVIRKVRHQVLTEQLCYRYIHG